MKNTVGGVSDTTFHQPANEKVTVNIIARQSVEKKKRKGTVILKETEYKNKS